MEERKKDSAMDILYPSTPTLFTKENLIKLAVNFFYSLSLPTHMLLKPIVRINLYFINIKKTALKTAMFIGGR